MTPEELQTARAVLIRHHYAALNTARAGRRPRSLADWLAMLDIIELAKSLMRAP